MDEGQLTGNGGKGIQKPSLNSQTGVDRDTASPRSYHIRGFFHYFLTCRHLLCDCNLYNHFSSTYFPLAPLFL